MGIDKCVFLDLFIKRIYFYDYFFLNFDGFIDYVRDYEI